MMAGRILICACVALTPVLMFLFTGFFTHGMRAQAAGGYAAEEEKKAGKSRTHMPFAKLWKRSAIAMLLLSLALTLPFLGGDGTGLAIMGIVLCVAESLVLLLLLFAWNQREARRKQAEQAEMRKV